VSTHAEDDDVRVWKQVAAHLKGALNEGTYSTWFGAASGRRLDDATLEVSVPNEFTRSWIQGHFADEVAAAAKKATGDVVDVRFRVDPSCREHAAAERVAPEAAEERRDERTDAAPAQAAPNPSARAGRGARTPPAALAGPPPDEGDGSVGGYTFDHFVIGSSNRFAHAAALAVAEAPAQAYNPLFIHGSTGLGKTHLLQAIGHYVRSESGGLRACYVTSEAFLNDFIGALQAKRVEAFKSRYRTYDVLLVDDIQFIGGREGIQEEFFHTFNSLYEAGGQIVLSSDRPPRDIARLEDRLRSRFEWGLTTDIQPPDLETRIAILRKKAERDDIHVNDHAVLASIAQRIQTNIRELEGALTRVVAYASLNGVPVDHDLVRDVLRDQFPEGARPVTAEQIQKVVADAFNLTVADLKSDRRTQVVVYPRQLAMYLCREMTELSLPKVGAKFGGRDHTTVHYAEAKITRLIREDRSVYSLVQDLTTRIRRI
jgi:chromosomal replication initiator protein